MFLLFKEIEIIKIIMTIALHKKTFQVSKARKQFIKSSICNREVPTLDKQFKLTTSI